MIDFFQERFNCVKQLNCSEVWQNPLPAMLNSV